VTRTALITGASRGLGAALVRGLAERGWELIIDARTVSDLDEVARSAPRLYPIHVVPGDLVDASHRDDLASTAEGIGGLDTVVLNGGTLGPSPLPPVSELDLDDLRRTFEVNTIAQVGLIQTLAPVLRPSAAVIAITSDAAAEAYPGWGAYGASKVALEHLARVLAEERPDLRVLRVDPGDLRTAMHQAAFPGEDISDRPLPDVAVPGIVHLIEGQLPSGRYRVPELAPVVGAG
jgi:NAD(P)-dependent dehydrogenase (short-subunit alcohol dehydrogenase family)